MSITTPSSSPPRPQPQPSGPSGGMPTLGPKIDPFRILRRYFWLLVVVGFISVVLGVALYVVLSRFMPRFSANVLFEVKPGLTSSMQVGEIDIRNEDMVVRMAKTETVLLTSRQVLLNAVKTREVAQTSWIQGFQDAGVTDFEAAVDELEEDLNPIMPRQTNLFGVAWSAAVATDVPVVLNMIADAYLKKREADDREKFSENRKVFDTQLRDATSEIEALTLEIQRYIRENGIVAVGSTSNPQGKSIEDVVGRITEAQSRLRAAASRRQVVEAKLVGTMRPSDEDILQARIDPAARQVEGVVTTLRLRLEQARQQYRQPDHPAVRDLEIELEAAESAYDTKLDEIMRQNLTAELNELSNQLESLNNQIEGLEDEYGKKDTELRDLAAVYSEYQAMENRREMLEKTRDNMLQLIRELELMRARSDAARVRPAQRAQVPRVRSFPRIVMIVPLVTLVSMGLTLGLIFLRELTDHRVKGASDLAVLPGVRVLGVIPDCGEDDAASAAPARIVEQAPNCVVAESYRQAATPLFNALKQTEARTVVVIGGMPESGSTTVVANLAATKSAEGRRVAVIDANFRRPGVAPVYDLDEEGPGLGDVLAGEAELHDVLRSAPNGVDVITAGTPAKRVFERLSTLAFDELLAALRESHDFVFVDVPPAVVAGEAMVVANKVDAAVLVVCANREHRGLVSRLSGQLRDAHAQFVGVVINRARITVGGYFKQNFAAMGAYARTKR